MDSKETIQDFQDTTSAILLREHERISSLYQYNVGMGDKYLTTYLSIISLFVALIVAVGQFGFQPENLITFEIVILFVILIVGIISFIRLTERRTRSIEYLRAINRIHCYFVKRDPKIRQYLSWPAFDDCPPMRLKGTSLGGLRDIVASLNSLVSAFLLIVFLKVWIPGLENFYLLLAGAIIFMASMFVQNKISNKIIDHADKEFSKHIQFPEQQSHS